MNRFIKIDVTTESGDIYRNYPYASVPATMGIETGSLKLDEILCVDEVKYGQYNSNKFEVRLFGINGDNAYALPDMSNSKIKVWAETEYDYPSILPYLTYEDYNDDIKITGCSTDAVGSFIIPETINNKSVVFIGAGAFEGCEDITDIIMPNTIEYLGNRCFASCDSLRSIVISDSVYTLPISFCEESYALKEVYIGRELSEVNANAFTSSNLTVYYAKTESEWNNIIIDEDNASLQNATKIYRTNFTGYKTDLIFVGEIDSAKRPDKDIYRDIVAYDYMYKKQSIDIGDLWNSYWNSFVVRKEVTLKTLREDVCAFVGLTPTTNQVALQNDNVYFCNHNDNLSVSDTVRPVVPRFTNMTFKDLISAICEIQGCIPNMNRSGNIEFVKIARGAYKVVDETSNLDTTQTTVDDFTTTISRGFNVYATSETLTYQSISSATNPYIISGNIFLNTMSSNFVESIINALHQTVGLRQTPAYTSGKVDLIISDLSLKLGDMLKISQENQVFVMSISLSGSLLVDEHIESYSYGPTRNPKPSSDNDNLLQNLEYKEQRSDLNGVKNEVESLSKTSMTKDAVEIEVQKLYNNGVSKVVTSGKSYRFDDSGLNISDPNSPMSTLITENGMEVRKDGTATLDVNYQGVDAKNLKASTFLLIGNRSRFENYGEDRTGCFYVKVQ